MSHRAPPQPQPGELQLLASFVFGHLSPVSKHFENDLAGMTVVVTDIDVVETNPGAGDQILFGTNVLGQAFFWAPQVPAGLTQAFSNHWDGLIVLQNGQQVTAENLQQTGTALWQLQISGFVIPQQDTYTLTVGP